MRTRAFLAFFFCLPLLLCGTSRGPGKARLAHAEDEDATAPSIVLSDLTEDAGLSGVKGDRFSFGDFDRDGDPDLLVEGRILLRNDTKKFGSTTAEVTFVDISAESGMSKGAGGGACWVDMDGDGRLDVVTQNGALKLQVKDGQFEDRAKAFGLPAGQKASCVGVGDFDGDGWPDVLYGGGEDWNGGKPKLYPRHLYRNVDGKGLKEVSGAHDLATARYGRAVVWADFDRDGDQDVYLGNYRLQPNELLVNDGGTLTNRAEALGVRGRYEPAKFFDKKTGKRHGFRFGHTIASSWSDLDGDGDLDLWVSNLVHKYVGQGKDWYDTRGYLCDDSAFYRNDGPPAYHFSDRRPGSSVPYRPRGGRGTYRGDELWSNAAAGDLDGDGLPEVFVAQVYQLEYAHTLLFKNKGEFRFEEISGNAGLKRFNSYGGALADVDGDGDLDLVCGGSKTPKGKAGVCLYRNETPPGPWLAFRLEGRGPDTGALGAQVTVVTDKGTYVRQVESSMGSHAQQNENVLRFGLRDQTIQRIAVRWPGNIVQDLPVPELSKVHTLKFPKGFASASKKNADLPRIEATAPESAEAGTLVRFQVRGRGLGAGRWVWSADVDGSGVFKPLTGKRIVEGRYKAPLAEVRVRLTRKGRGLHREMVVRFPVEEAEEDAEK